MSRWKETWTKFKFIYIHAPGLLIHPTPNQWEYSIQPPIRSILIKSSTELPTFSLFPQSSNIHFLLFKMSILCIPNQKVAIVLLNKFTISLAFILFLIFQFFLYIAWSYYNVCQKWRNIFIEIYCILASQFNLANFASISHFCPFLSHFFAHQNFRYLADIFHAKLFIGQKKGRRGWRENEIAK